MPELTKEERLARALSLSQAEETVQEETPKQLTKEERLARALKLSEEDKKKSQSQSGSSTEKSSSGTSETKKEQSSGTEELSELEAKKKAAREQKLNQLGVKAQENTITQSQRQREREIQSGAEKERQKQQPEKSGLQLQKEQEMAEKIKAIQPIIPEIQKAEEKRKIPTQEERKLAFEGNDKYLKERGLSEEEIEKERKSYLNQQVNLEMKRDLDSQVELLTKFMPAPKDFKEGIGVEYNRDVLNKAKELNFDKIRNLALSVSELDENQRYVVEEYSKVMDRLNAYREKSYLQKKQGADEKGKGSVVITPKEDAQFSKDVQRYQMLSKEIDKIRGNNNKLFDELAEVINKEDKKSVTQDSIVAQYGNDYMKVKSALEKSTYKLNYLEKEIQALKEKMNDGNLRSSEKLEKETNHLRNLIKEKNIAKAEVLALNNAVFLNEDITKKIKKEKFIEDKIVGAFKDFGEGYAQYMSSEFLLDDIDTEKQQARVFNNMLKEVGIDIKGADEDLKASFSETLGSTMGLSTVLGGQIAITSLLTGGVGTLARGAGLLPKVFELYDKGGKFKAIADIVISGINFELASEESSFAMGVGEESAQLLFQAATKKLKPLNKIADFFTKSLVGATGITVEEYAGDFLNEIAQLGISQEAFDNAFGASQEEGLEKLALTFAMGMMGIGKHAKVLLVGSYTEAKAKNPESETVKEMEAVLSEMGLDPDDFIAELKKQAETKSNRAYPDGNGGVLLASNMTEEQEIALREKLGIKPLTEEELAMKRSVQQTPDLDADSPYTTKEEMEADLRLLKGEEEGTLPNTYVGESVLTDEGIVTTVTEKVEEVTQLRVPTEQLVTEEAKAVDDKFDREKAGVIDVWQDPETNELVVVNGTKRVATAFEDGVASVDIRVLKANSLVEAKQVGELINKLQDTEKKQEAVDLVKANPNLKETLDLNNPKELELYGLASLNESLSEELKSNPKQAGVLAVIGNSVSTEKQSEVYQFAKDNKLSVEEVAQLVKEKNLKQENVVEKVKLKTEQSKTGQSNIDAVKKDAAQLGVEPNNLYESILKLSPTAQGLIEKYSKAIADGLYSSSEAVLRLNAEIKENFDTLVKEIDMPKIKKDVAQLESAFTSERKTLAEKLIDISNKINIQADKIGKNTYSIIVPGGPLVAKYFLKALSLSLKTSATFAEALQKAIKSLKRSKHLKGKTAKEVNDIIAQLTKAATELQRKAELKNPTTKKQQDIIKQSVKAKIMHLNNNFLNTIPSIASIEKLAKREGIIDAKEFAEKLFKEIRRLESEKEKRFNSLDETVKHFLSNKKENVDALFNQLSDLILKDKQQAVILKNAFIDAMLKHSVKGVKFTSQQINQITKAFESTKLNTLSGIYDLTQKLDQIVNKAVDVTLNNKIKELQKSVSRYAKSIKNVKQKEYIQALTELTASQILDEKLKLTLIDTLENVKDYLSNKANLDYNEKTSQDNLKAWQDKIEEYKKNKEEALIEKSYENFLDNNPGVSMSLDDYKDLILPLEEKAKNEEKHNKQQANREAKRQAFEDLTKRNIQSILDYFRVTGTTALNYAKIGNVSALKIQAIGEFISALDFYLKNDLLNTLSIEQLSEINRVHTELEHFDSYSKLGAISAQLNGVRRAIENQANIIGKLRDFSNKLKRILFAPNRNLWRSSDLSLKGLHRFIERTFVGQEANTIGAIIFGSFDNGKNLAITKSNEFAQKLKKLSDFELNRKENFDLGVKAFLLSSPVNATEMDAQLLFERKKEKIAMDIERLNKVANDNNQSESTRKQARIRAELYQNSLDSVNQYDNYADYVAAYENGTLLTKSQKLVDDFVKSEYNVQQPLLKDSNELYNDKEFEELNHYSSVSYLNSTDVDVKSTEELDNNLNQRSIDDATSGTTIKRVKDPRTVKDILDFDYYNVSKRRVLENYIDIHTKGDRIKIKAFLDSEHFTEVFKGNTALLNEFKARLVSYLNSSLANKKSNLKQDNILYKYLAKLIRNFKLHVLARPGQIVKQLTITAHALARLDIDFVKATGIYLANRFTSSGQEKLRLLTSGADSANRMALGDEQFSQEVAKLSERNLTATEVYKFLDKQISKMFGTTAGKIASDVSVKYPTKIAGGVKATTIDSGIHLMTYPDLLINKLTFIAAMIEEQRKQVKKGVSGKEKLGVFTSINTLIDNKDIENTYKADRVAGFINNESDANKQGGMFTNQSIPNMLFYQFRSMAVNASMGAQNAMLDLFDKKATIKDREIALRNLVGWSASIVTFHAVSLLLSQLTEKVLDDPLREFLGADKDKDKAKKKLNFIDNIGEEEFMKQFLFQVVMRAGIDGFAGAIVPAGVTEEIGRFMEPKVKKWINLATDMDVESPSVFYGGFGKYSGAIENAIGVWDAFTDIPSPYVKKAEKLREKDVVDIIEAQFEVLQERPQETLVDIAYQLSMVAGKGTPSQVFGTMKKVLRENYGVKSGDYERLNPAQNPKKEK